MTNLKEIKETLDEIINKAKKEALDAGINILSKEFEAVLFELKRRLLQEKGITLEQLEEYEESEVQKKKETKSKISELESKIIELETKITEEIIPRGISALKGEQGIDGKVGKDGKDGKSITGKEGPQGKKGDSIIGSMGPQGIDGKSGRDGKDGSSVNIKELDEQISKQVKDKIKSEVRGFSETLMGDKAKMSKDLQNSILEPVRRMGMGLQEQVDTLAGKITTENLWDRSGTTLSQHITGDDIDLGSGSIISSSNADITLTPNGTGRVTGVYRYIEIRLLDKDTDHTVATVGGEFRVPKAMTVKNVGAYVDTAGVTGTATIDINEAGTTILSTKVTIDTTEKTSETAAAAPVISDASIAADAIITFDIDVIQATAAKGLVVWLEVVM